MSHRLNCVQSPFTVNIVLEQPRAKNGSLFRVKNVFFAREKHITLKSTNEIQH